MRTQEEILARLSVEDDIFGTVREDLVDFLNFDNAKPFLVEGAPEADWNEYQKHDPLKEIADYLPFAWDKANNCRGLSAARSIAHFKNWLWLANRDDLVEKLEDYEYYGKPQLVMLSKLVGFDHTEFSSPNWVNDECGNALSDEGKRKLIKLWEGYAS